MQFGLGTVQFGSAYGVTNARGRVSGAEVIQLLELAAAEGVTVLDTAAAYGESEAVLGRALSDPHPFRIVTKTAPIASGRIGDAELRQTREAFHRSLERLRARAVHGLLVHHAAELLRPGGETLAELLRELKRMGLVAKIGFSCSTVGELAAASDVLTPDLVQVTANVLDRRFSESEKCARLRAHGTEVHARSVFLQGLLLAPIGRLPPRFAAHRAAFERLDAHAERHSMSRIELVIGYAVQCSAIDVALFGVSALDEMRQVLQTIRNAPSVFDAAALRYDDERLLDPSLWPVDRAGMNMGATS